MIELYNKYGENLVNLFGSIYYLYTIFLSTIILTFFALRRIFKAKYKPVLIIIIFAAFFDYSLTIQAYKNGERIIELKRFGLKIVNCIDDFKKEKNMLPENLQVLNSCFSPADFEKVLKIAKYNVFKKKNSEEYYSLTIYEDFLGIYYLAYRENEKRFVYTDE